MRIPFAASLLSGLCVFAAAAMAQDKPPPLPFDTPTSMRAVEAVCTGIGADAREDPRWDSYPLKVELAGKAGQLLGEAQVTIVGKGDEALASVTCGGPWVLFKLMPGAYQVKAEIEGTEKTAKVNVGAKGQARVTIRFPEVGGATSPEYVPK